MDSFSFFSFPRLKILEHFCLSRLLTTSKGGWVAQNSLGGSAVAGGTWNAAVCHIFCNRLCIHIGDGTAIWRGKQEQINAWHFLGFQNFYLPKLPSEPWRRQRWNEKRSDVCTRARVCESACSPEEIFPLSKAFFHFFSPAHCVRVRPGLVDGISVHF